MKKILFAASAALFLMTACNNNENPLLRDSKAPFGAPEFNKIKAEHYFPAMQEAVKEGKAEIDAIVNCTDEPDFNNTIAALESAGRRYADIGGIFYNLLEADSSDELQQIAEKAAPLANEYEMYISLNEGLFRKIKAVYKKRDSLGLEPDQYKLTVDTYEAFERNGANLSEEDKKTYGELSEQLSLLQLKYKKNVLAATNAYTLNLTDTLELEGLPEFLREQGAESAKAKGQEGWTFDLSYPSYAPFMKYSARRELREKMFRAYNSKALGGEFDNSELVKDIVGTRIKIANILGYGTYAEYALKNRMAKTPETVNTFLKKLLLPALPVAKQEVAEINGYALANGFEGKEIMPWDFSYWSEKYKLANYNLSDEELKPYFRLENCIDAVLGLSTKLYGLHFTERKDIPVYHKDVKVYEVTDESGRHVALFYADFFPRESKRGGAWMTEFRGQRYLDGKEQRPLVSIVTNFTKPTATTPSLITHDELTTFLHEFGHALHGMLAEGRYGSQTGTNVARDFVELPSQIMENWGYEPEYLNTFAKHYKTGETIDAELVGKIVKSKNYLSAYYHIRQLQFGILDMAWHNRSSVPAEKTVSFEKSTLKKLEVLPQVQGTCISTSFSHIFSGGYSAGYYSYKWAEVLEADAFSLFKEKGIFNRGLAESFRRNILSKGSSMDETVLYRNFRGHDPEPEALLRKLGIIK